MNNQWALEVCLCLHLWVLTSCVAVQQEGVLELEVQVFCDWLCQVLHAESIHYGETMPGRCQPETQRGHSTDIRVIDNKQCSLQPS